MDKSPALIKKIEELKKSFKEDDTSDDDTDEDSEVDTDIDSPENSNSPDKKINNNTK